MHTHHRHGGTTIVESDSDSSSGIVIGVIVAFLVLFLIWLFAFSGWVGSDQDVNRGQGTTNIEREGDTNVNVPGGTQNNNSSPAPSPGGTTYP